MSELRQAGLACGKLRIEDTVKNSPALGSWRNNFRIIPLSFIPLITGDHVCYNQQLVWLAYCRRK